VYGLVIAPIEFVLVLLLVRIARDEGQKIQPGLIREWDGMPTTRFLRHRNNEIERPAKGRYKESLTKLTGYKFPTADEEASDPAAADEIYSSAIGALREQR
jgi:hypothetical protein